MCYFGETCFHCRVSVVTLNKKKIKLTGNLINGDREAIHSCHRHDSFPTQKEILHAEKYFSLSTNDGEFESAAADKELKQGSVHSFHSAWGLYESFIQEVW